MGMSITFDNVCQSDIETLATVYSIVTFDDVESPSWDDVLGTIEYILTTFHDESDLPEDVSASIETACNALREAIKRHSAT